MKRDIPLVLESNIWKKIFLAHYLPRELGLSLDEKFRDILRYRFKPLNKVLTLDYNKIERLVSIITTKKIGTIPQCTEVRWLESMGVILRYAREFLLIFPVGLTKFVVPNKVTWAKVRNQMEILNQIQKLFPDLFVKWLYALEQPNYCKFKLAFFGNLKEVRSKKLIIKEPKNGVSNEDPIQDLIRTWEIVKEFSPHVKFDDFLTKYLKQLKKGILKHERI